MGGRASPKSPAAKPPVTDGTAPVQAGAVQAPEAATGGDVPQDATAVAQVTILEALTAEPIDMIEVKASRPTYRRAGFVFGDRDWTVLPPRDVSEEQGQALMADPVLSIRLVFASGPRLLSFQDRQALAAAAAADDDTDD